MKGAETTCLFTPSDTKIRRNHFFILFSFALYHFFFSLFCFVRYSVCDDALLIPLLHLVYVFTPNYLNCFSSSLVFRLFFADGLHLLIVSVFVHVRHTNDRIRSANDFLFSMVKWKMGGTHIFTYIRTIRFGRSRAGCVQQTNASVECAQSHSTYVCVSQLNIHIQCNWLLAPPSNYFYLYLLYSFCANILTHWKWVVFLINCLRKMLILLAFGRF